MGVELAPDQVERLLELDRKFGKEGLTFDDVLLVPAESRVLPNDVSTDTRLTRGITIEIPIVSAAMSGRVSCMVRACRWVSASLRCWSR